MKRAKMDGGSRFRVVALLTAALLGLAGVVFAARADNSAVLIDVSGAIGPATVAYVEGAIADAQARDADVLILQMDTPGGLDSSMRSIVKAITASSVPVAGYVAPTGARAASAGTYILYACHIAAMAPGTTLGAATPVQLIGRAGEQRDIGRSAAAGLIAAAVAAADEDTGTGAGSGSGVGSGTSAAPAGEVSGQQPRVRSEDVPEDSPARPSAESGAESGPESSAESDAAFVAKSGAPSDAESKSDTEPGSEADAKTRKLVNDAAAYLRGLANLRGRNAEWAEQAVREGVSLSAEEALELNVIDLIAPDLESLLAAMDGRSVRVGESERTLRTAGADVVVKPPDWKTRLLAIISDPNVAYILMLVGIYGLVYEFSNPGAVLPGTVGAVSLLLALYAFQLLPINYAGMALIILGLALMIAEAFAPSFGALGIGGGAAFVVGSLILIDTGAPGFGLSIPLIVGFAIGSALLLFFIVAMALRAYRKPVGSGAEEMLGAVGEALDGFPGGGSVHVHGEVWTARSEVAIPSHAPVRVVGRDGLTLLVEPAEPSR
jgi:membrane-bound serine protease (ClpP class)